MSAGASSSGEPPKRLERSHKTINAASAIKIQRMSPDFFAGAAAADAAVAAVAVADAAAEVAADVAWVAADFTASAACPKSRAERISVPPKALRTSPGIASAISDAG